MPLRNLLCVLIRNHLFGADSAIKFRVTQYMSLLHLPFANVLVQ